MSDKNFMSYGDAESVLTEFAGDIKNRLEKVTSFPSDADAVDGQVFMYVGNNSKYVRGGVYKCHKVTTHLLGFKQNNTDNFVYSDDDYWPEIGSNVYDENYNIIGKVTSRSSSGDPPSSYDIQVNGVLIWYSRSITNPPRDIDFTSVEWINCEDDRLQKVTSFPSDADAVDGQVFMYVGNDSNYSYGINYMCSKTKRYAFFNGVTPTAQTCVYTHNYPPEVGDYVYDYNDNLLSDHNQIEDINYYSVGKYYEIVTDTSTLRSYTNSGIVKQFDDSIVDWIPCEDTEKIDKLRSAVVFTGVHNLAKLQFADGYSEGMKNITYSYNNGEVTLSAGTASGQSYTFPASSLQGFDLEADRDYVLTGVPANAPSGVSLRLRYNNGSNVTVAVDEGSGAKFTFTSAMKNASVDYHLMINIASGTVIPAGGIVIRPMIRYAEDNDTTFKKHALTNMELTNMLSNSGKKLYIHNVSFRVFNPTELLNEDPDTAQWTSQDKDDYYVGYRQIGLNNNWEAVSFNNSDLSTYSDYDEDEMGDVSGFKLLFLSTDPTPITNINALYSRYSDNGAFSDSNKIIFIPSSNGSNNSNRNNIVRFRWNSLHVVLETDIEYYTNGTLTNYISDTTKYMWIFYESWLVDFNDSVYEWNA